MVSEERVVRIEDKLDKLQISHSELRSDVRYMAKKLDESRKIMEEHVAGDQKIINQLTGIIPDLKEMIVDYKHKKSVQADKKEKWDNKVKLSVDLAKFLTVVSITVGIVTGVMKLWP